MKIVTGANIYDNNVFHVFPNLMLGYDDNLAGIAIVWGFWYCGIGIEF